jgi:hypothetical protein
MGLEFGAVSWPLRSGDGRIALERDVDLPLLGGALRFEGVALRPPAGGRGLEVELGMTLRDLDVARLAQAMQWPAFKGRLDGRIPKVRYATTASTLTAPSARRCSTAACGFQGLAMERPFGTAPTLAADVAFDDLNLQSLTEVFGFGEITGALDGSIRQLRLVDWSAQAFAGTCTPTRTGRASGASASAPCRIFPAWAAAEAWGQGLQAQALKLFEDFRYRRIGIRCRLANGVCGWTGSVQWARALVSCKGQGCRAERGGFQPRRRLAYLVDRLVAVTQGESTPSSNNFWERRMVRWFVYPLSPPRCCSAPVSPSTSISRRRGPGGGARVRRESHRRRACADRAARARGGSASLAPRRGFDWLALVGIGTAHAQEQADISIRTPTIRRSRAAWPNASSRSCRRVSMPARWA